VNLFRQRCKKTIFLKKRRYSKVSECLASLIVVDLLIIFPQRIALLT